jgi:hypothetical protein
MATLTSHTLPAGTPLDSFAVAASVRALSLVPRNQPINWLITVRDLGSRVEVVRTAQLHHGHEALYLVSREPIDMDAQAMPHWELVAYGGLFTPEQIAILRALER